MQSTDSSHRAILESLKHRNIVQLIQKIKDPKNEQIYIVMEVRQLRTILSYLADNRRSTALREISGQ